ncbi:tRNA uridine-5-carboxymethylaminomethyl(34) synthesis GTPase MnmE [Ascidiaceihabitans sp.]|uniref:tRNA uridine-5-carboxymethylaminomethyl(34) synthesis GTPase MnmE n=1 Tax=Ascidiaceihabitans sp. TaxID=1872644 RepID=UPI003296D26B
METIFALASAQGRSGVAVIRISGPNALSAAKTLTHSLPKDRVAGLRSLFDGSGALLDKALVLCFAGPNSFTGEDVVEFHLHGSIAVVQAVMKELSNRPSVRLAEPGEFTRRALENGRMDLAQVEGLADLIESETEAQRVQALKTVSGHLGDLVEGWRSSLIRSASLIEATIDFADEDVPVDVSPEVRGILQSVRDELVREIDGSHVAERIRLGFEVAIIGPPNAGKSTLLNALAGRDVAITSDIAGTTRDVIEVRMDLNGLPVTFLDTAGLREGQDTVEQIGIDRALDRAKQADLRVVLAKDGQDFGLELTDDDIVVAPKADLTGQGISGLTGRGVEGLLKRVQTTLSKRSSTAGLATHERHRVAMTETHSVLLTVLPLIDRGPEHYDIAAEELRTAVRSLEALIGRIDVENLLDEIFASFCLGK